MRFIKANQIPIIILLIILLFTLVIVCKFNSKNSLEEFMKLQGEWFIKNQRKEGDFVYERYVGSGTEKPGNNMARQALSLYSMSLLYKHIADPKLRIALEKGYDYFKNKSHKDQIILDGVALETEAVMYDGDIENNTNAFVLLSLINYMEKDSNAKEKYLTYSKNLANYLLSTQAPDGSFIYIKSKADSRSDFNNGETFYALVRMYSFDGNPLYLGGAKKAADNFINHYSGTKFNQKFYSWGVQGFYYLYLIDPQDKYWIFMKNYTDIFIRDFGDNTEKYFRNRGSIAPPLGLSLYLEGIIHVAKLAQDKDPGYYLKLKRLIDDSIIYLMSFQINGPKSNRTSNDKVLTGGICFDYYCVTQRIDVTGHSLSASYFYLTLLLN